MNQNRLPDYLDHIQQAATDACSFVEGITNTLAKNRVNSCSKTGSEFSSL